MKAFTLNLATRPFRNNRTLGSILGGAAGVLILATAGNLYIFLNYGGTYAALQRQERDDRARLTELETRERDLAQQIQGRDFKTAFERGRFAGDVILKRSFSWTLLFNKLETVVPPEVMMTAIRPNIGERGIVIHITGIAKNHGALIALEDALLANPAFSRVYPASERRVNPSRPEISFALNCDYLPRHTAAAPAAALTASGAPPQPAPAEVAPAEGSPPAASATASAAGATPGAHPVRPAAPSSPGPVPGTVGRDGAVRTAASMLRLVAAPGGVSPAPADGAPIPASSSGKSGPPSHQRAAGGTGTAAAAAPRSDAAAAGRSGVRGAPPAPASGTDASGPAASDGPVRAAMPPAGKPEPNAPGRRAASAPSAVAGAREPTPVPARRLDLPLVFAERPVQEVYAALAQAHHVRFRFDAAVDQAARVSANLAGRGLDDALSVVGVVAGHRVTRQGDGAYRVAVAAGGQPMADRPVKEESLGSAP